MIHLYLGEGYSSYNCTSFTAFMFSGVMHIMRALLYLTSIILTPYISAKDIVLHFNSNTRVISLSASRCE